MLFHLFSLVLRKTYIYALLKHLNFKFLPLSCNGLLKTNYINSVKTKTRVYLNKDRDREKERDGKGKRRERERAKGMLGFWVN